MRGQGFLLIANRKCRFGMDKPLEIFAGILEWRWVSFLVLTPQPYKSFDRGYVKAVNSIFTVNYKFVMKLSHL